MWRSFLTFSIAALCIVLGLSIAGYKHFALGFPLLPDSEVSSWYVELKTTLQSPERTYRDAEHEREITADILLPSSGERYAVAEQHVMARGFGKQDRIDRDRPIVQFTKGSPSSMEIITMRFMLYELHINEETTPETEESLAAAIQTPYAKKVRVFNPEQSLAAVYDTIDLIVDEAMKKSSSGSSFLPELWKILDREKETAEYLMQNMNIHHKPNLMMVLARVAGYPTRIANGLKLEPDMVSSASIRRWVETYEDNAWVRFNSDDGKLISPQTPLYRWWIGSRELVRAEGVGQHVTQVSIKPNNDSALTRALWQASKKQPLAYSMALSNLPVEQQMVLQILLLLPIGALIVAFMRQVVGVKTFGTFMPVLIALAFRDTGLSTGVLFFVGLTFIGLLMRSYLAHLRLLLVPRLSAVLCIVVTLIMLVMLWFNNMNTSTGLSIALFPVVIMTMFIERMSNMWDEKGAKGTLIAFSGTLLTACLIYAVVTNQHIRHAMMTFPELLLLVFACCLVLGRYTGFRFTEYLRFRELKRELQRRQMTEQASHISSNHG